MDRNQIYKDAFGRELAKVQNDNGKMVYLYRVRWLRPCSHDIATEASDRLIPPNAVSADIIAKYAYRYIYDGLIV